MSGCVDAGLHADGVLPGMLQVKRRAGTIRAQLEAVEAEGHRELPGEWLGAFALAVNEENAAGGRVVTAPTNGAAGILPRWRCTGGASSPTRGSAPGTR